MNRTCGFCGTAIEGSNSRRKYCGSTCRARASEESRRSQRRPDNAEPAEVLALPPSDASETAVGRVEAATLAELEVAGRQESAAGVSALALAQRIDHGVRETGSAFAALVREYRATLAEAVRDGAKAADPLDELRARRERKHSAG